MFVIDSSLSLILRCVFTIGGCVSNHGNMLVQVYSSFLDVLTIFIELKTQSLDDWLFMLLLRLIHKQGGDNLSSVVQKLTMVLDTVR